MMSGGFEFETPALNRASVLVNEEIEVISSSSESSDDNDDEDFSIFEDEFHQVSTKV
jgi:hypothetical protein